MLAAPPEFTDLTVTAGWSRSQRARPGAPSSREPTHHRIPTTALRGLATAEATGVRCAGEPGEASCALSASSGKTCSDAWVALHVVPADVRLAECSARVGHSRAMVPAPART